MTKKQLPAVYSIEALQAFTIEQERVKKEIAALERTIKRAKRFNKVWGGNISTLGNEILVVGMKNILSRLDKFFKAGVTKQVISTHASAHAKKAKGVPKRDRVDYTKAKTWAAAIRKEHPNHSARQVAAIIISPTEAQRQDYGIDDTYKHIKVDTLRQNLKKLQ